MTEPIRPWRQYADEEWERLEASWSAADPVEEWSWSCPRCSASLPRSAIRAHLDDHDARPEAVIVWVALAVALAVGVVVAVVVTRG